MELHFRYRRGVSAGAQLIQDKNDVSLFYIDEFWSATKKRILNTMDGKPIYVVKNEYWNMVKRKGMILSPDETEEIARMEGNIISFQDKYKIESKFGNYEIVGNMLLFNYTLYKEGKQIGHIARRISSKEAFVLTLSDDEKHLSFYVAMVMALDNIDDDRKLSIH